MRKRPFTMIVWGILILAAIPAVVMLLWNYVLATVINVAVINFWQALGLFALARILFGGFGGFHRFGRPHDRRMWGGMYGGMPGGSHNPIQEKWMKMTPEERKNFIEKRKRFGFGAPPFGREEFFGKEGFFDREGFSREGFSREDFFGKDKSKQTDETESAKNND